MPLTLTLQNETSLPDGGPLSVTVRGKRGLDIGRDSHLDWSLPDVSRYISGKHCEVRWRDGGYWLHDVSTNGTFVNGSDRRISEPHRLRNGDKIVIGQYIVLVALDGEEAQGAPSHSVKPAASYEEIWNAGSAAPPPIDPRDLRPVAARSQAPDFLDWAVDVPPPVAPPPQRARPRNAESEWEGADMAWAPPKPAPPPPEPPPPVPVPRRPSVPDEARLPPPPAPVDAPMVQPETFAPRRPSVQIVTDPPFANPAPTMPRAVQLDSYFDHGPASSPPPAGAGAQTPPPYTPNPLTPSPYTPAPLRSAPSVPPPVSAQHGDGAEFVTTFAKAAGLPDGLLASTSADELAHMLGELLLGLTDDIMKLMQARAEARRMARAVNQTMIQALGNNPLKAMPTAKEALGIMFGRKRPSYLDARAAFGEALGDLKTHQILSFTAMQRAIQMLVEDLSPEEIEKSISKERGLAAMVSSRKARAFDVYAARWNAKTMRQENGMLGALLLLFAQAYEEAESKARPPQA